MLNTDTSRLPDTMPPLLFGEKEAKPAKGFHGMVDQFSHLTPKCDYDTKAKNGFVLQG